MLLNIYITVKNMKVVCVMYGFSLNIFLWKRKQLSTVLSFVEKKRKQEHILLSDSIE